MVSALRRVSKVKERGVAVIMAMWLLAVLAIIGTTFAFMMRLEPVIARNQRNEIMAMYAAQAGLDYAVYLLKKDRDTDAAASDKYWDTTREAWATTFKGSDMDNDEDGRMDSAWITLTDTAGNIYGYYAAMINSEGSASDGGGKVNINNPANDTWQTLLDGLYGVDSDTAQNIITYQAAKNFDTIDELDRVNGIGADSLPRRRRECSVYPVEPGSRLPININLAGPDVLRAWVTRDTSSPYQIPYVTETNQKRFVEAILSYIAGSNGQLRTSDDNPFDGVDDNSGDTVGPGSGNFPDSDDGGTTTGEPRDEFNIFMEYLRTNSYSISSEADIYSDVGPGIWTAPNTYAIADNLKDNADPSTLEYSTYGEAGYSTWTTHLSFKSPDTAPYKYYEIMSTGQIRDASGNALATKKLRATLDSASTGAGGVHVILYYKEIPED